MFFRKQQKSKESDNLQLDYTEKRFQLIESRITRIEKLLYFIALVSAKSALDFFNNFL